MKVREALEILSKLPADAEIHVESRCLVDDMEDTLIASLESISMEPRHTLNTGRTFEDVMSMAPAAIFRCNGIPEDGSDIIADDDEP